MNIQSRWKSYILWSALGGVVIMFLQTAGVLEKMGITNEYANYIINTLLTALIALGIINDPSNADRV